MALSSGIQTDLAGVRKSLEKLMLGYFAPPLPAPPSQTAFDLVLHVEQAVRNWEAAAVGTAAITAAIGVCETAQAVADRYVEDGMAEHSEWEGERVKLVNWQRAQASQVFSAAERGEAQALTRATQSFETAHALLRDGNGKVSPITPERGDLLRQWNQIDVAWARFRAEAESQNVQSMRMALTDLQAALVAAVPLFGVADRPSSQISPWLLVATYCGMGLLLFACGCAGCMIFLRTHRQKTPDVPAKSDKV